VFQGSYLQVIVSMQGCIYGDPIYYLFISELSIFSAFCICSFIILALFPCNYLHLSSTHYI
jgi:hypothetical protein